MLKVIAQDFIHPESIGIVTPLYRELVDLTRTEPLCLGYDLFINQKDPGHFIFVELWPDAEALEIHCQTAHFRRLVPQINAHARADCQFLRMDLFAG